MKYIIVDLEATCWEKNQTPDRMETIEIGAVSLESASAAPSSEFAKFIKPVSEPILSDFCKNLTTITQEEINQAEYFYQVFPTFLEWIGNDSFTICSWGNYDMNQFRTDCRRHKISFPDTFLNHINLKTEFAAVMNVKSCGMAKALKILEIELDGTHHRGIDDARNIAKIAQIILPKIEAETI